jgi:drug/metabolite transporter (DMT)-like permease
VVAVLFAALGGLAFGCLPLLVRRGLQLSRDVMGGVAVQSVVGLVVCGSVALARGETDGDLLPFVAIGLLVPGLSTVLLTGGVREAGPSRTSMIMNTQPLLSITIALVLLGEPFHLGLVAGALLIVVGALALVGEPGRPQHVRRVGLLLAFAAGAAFSMRDNILRWLSIDTDVAPQLAGAATLAGATVFSLAVIAMQPGRSQWRERAVLSARGFWPAGVVVGFAYITMFEAYFRARVSVVSPLLSTAAFWGVLLPWLLIRDVEVVGRRLLVGSALIVTGGALIGIFK